jgi:L-aminoadipate-semialdehyde dehydrogenase
VTNTDDFLVRMLKGCVQLSSRPDISNSVNMVPVDHVARVVVASAFSPPKSSLAVIQITSHPRLTFNDFLATLETYGYSVSKVGYGSWKSKMEAYVDGTKEGQEQHSL